MLDNPQEHREAPDDVPEAGNQRHKAIPDSIEFFRGRLQMLTPRLVAMPAIVAINVLVFAVMVLTSGDGFSLTSADMVPWGANFGPATANGDWWRLLTTLFVHLGSYHLLINMGFLVIAGMFLERMVGAASFTSLYFLAGIAGGIASPMAVPPEVNATR